MPTTQQNERSSYRFLDPVVLPLLSQPHSTALASAKRYDNRYEAEYPRRTSENSLTRSPLNTPPSGAASSVGHQAGAWWCRPPHPMRSLTSPPSEVPGFGC